MPNYSDWPRRCSVRTVTPTVNNSGHFGRPGAAMLYTELDWDLVLGLCRFLMSCLPQRHIGDAGRRVQQGAVERGSVETISAAL